MDRLVYCAQIGSRIFPKCGCLVGSTLWLSAQSEQWDSGQCREEHRERAASWWGCVGYIVAPRALSVETGRRAREIQDPPRDFLGEGVG